MTPIEDAISALEDAAAALEKVPEVLRRTTTPGLWLGSPPPLVTPKLLRDEADHISRLVEEVRAADMHTGGPVTPDGEVSGVDDEEGRRWFGPMWNGWPDLEQDGEGSVFITNVYVGGPAVAADVEQCAECGDTITPDDHRCPNDDCPSHIRAGEGRRPVRDNPQA